MEEVKKKIEQILDQFLLEEKGNRLSQFSIAALKLSILQELNKLKEESPK